MTYSSSSIRRALIVKNDFSPFGNKLIAAGYVNNDQMKQAMSESRKSGKTLPETISGLTGRQLPPDLLRVYKKQQLFELKIIYGVECFDLEVSRIATTEMRKLIDSLIPIDTCRRHRLVPVSKSNTQPSSVLVAMVDPDNLDAQDDLNRILRSQGLRLQRLIITLEDCQQLLAKYLDQQIENQKQLDLQKAVDVKSDLEDLESLAVEGDTDEINADLSEAMKGEEEAPVISLVNKILIKALQQGVSDIHVEPQEEN